MIALASALFAADPVSAPGEKHITVASEIVRGFDVICHHTPPMIFMPVPHLAAILQSVLDGSEAQNTDSPGFLVGARLAELSAIDSQLAERSACALLSGDEIGVAGCLAQECYDELRKYEKQVGVNDEQLFAALGRTAATTRDLQWLLRRHAFLPAEVEARNLPRASPTPLPDFVLVSASLSVYRQNGQEVRLTRGTRLHVSSRRGNNVLVDFDGETFSIPSGLAKPAR